MSAFPPTVEGPRSEPGRDRRKLAVVTVSVLFGILARYLPVGVVWGVLVIVVALAVAVRLGVIAVADRRTPTRTLRLHADGIHRRRRFRSDETIPWADVVAVDVPNRWRSATRLRRRAQAPVDVLDLSADEALALQEWFERP